MKNPLSIRTLLSGLLLGVLTVTVLIRAVPGKDQPQGPAEWETDIRQFEEQDRKAPPAKGGILFIGSSSIRLWDLSRDFPDIQPINRGFGGSQIADSIHFADRIVLPYEPRTVVMYAGDNDIAAGKTPQQVHQDFVTFTQVVHKQLPDTRIVYIAIKPSLQRWKLVDTMREVNALIQATCQDDERLEFVDIDTPMIGDDGKPRPELFAKDGLHLSDEGYKLWTSLVRPHLIASP